MSIRKVERIDDFVKVKHIVISVFDKTGLDMLVPELIKLCPEAMIFSTGGTYKLIKQILENSHININNHLQEISEYTKMLETEGGLVKSLHHKLFLGYLTETYCKAHQQDLQREQAVPIDILIGNLYPFEQVTANSNIDNEEARGNIDVGGPSALRAAAKNWHRIATIVDPSDYELLIAELSSNDGRTTLRTRFNLHKKAFKLITDYNQAITNHLGSVSYEQAIKSHIINQNLQNNSKIGTDVTDMKRIYRTATEQDFPNELTINLQKESELRYGENPNQPAAVYRFKGTSLAEFTNIRLAKSGKAGLSATNFMDITRALEILKFFNKPSVAVMKHLIPSGFATQFQDNNLANIYKKARDADARSAFGSAVILNRPLDVETAEAIMESYVECVAAPEFLPGTLEILERKKDIRAVVFSNLDKIPKFIGDNTESLYDIKVLPTGRVIAQKPYLSSIKSSEDLIIDPLIRKSDSQENFVVEKHPTPEELSDMLTAWYVNLGVRSNGIVFVKDGVTIAVGSGQQERVGAVEQAITKAYQKAMDREDIYYDSINGADARGKLSNNPLKGAVVSSDAFFPLRDAIDTIAKVGVTAIIQPGGSIKDDEIIQAVNEHNIAMAFTRERCFGHF